MITFSTKILRFDKQAEKTGWTYIKISKRQAESLKPDNRVSFRVKGMLDEHPIQQTALLPIGNGDFILPLNATIRKEIRKKAGDVLHVKIQVDGCPLQLSRDLIKCLKDDPIAYAFFKSLPKSHQQYFSNWIESAKTSATKTKRLTMAVIALGLHQGYNEMIKANKAL
jgi:hypothetical protein